MVHLNMLRIWAVAGVFLAHAGYAADLFDTDVAPVFRQHCLPCHDNQSKTSGFSIESRDLVIAGGKRHGAAVKPGDPTGSPLIRMLRGQIQPQMPFGKPLPSEALAKIERWIGQLPREAAKAESRHWAFQKVTKPKPPVVRNTGWARNEIDRFVLSRLEAKGLSPAAEADRRTLARRLYFDLWGVPPTPDQVREFAESRSPLAYENLIDRLLADRRYGERWGRHWLDLARYSDTNGYEGDTDFPNAWRYRNYVIDAFHNDKPYDVFIKEQIAGDEFYYVNSAVPAPPPEPEKVVAMTFLRLAPFNRTPVSDENRDSYLTEVVTTVSSAFLGLTVGCAKCHDHKYDQIPQKDFYRMKAFFATLQITNTGRVGGAEPADFYRPGEKERMEGLKVKYENDLKDEEARLKQMQTTLLAKLAENWKHEKPDAKKGPEVRDLDRAIGNEGDNTAALGVKKVRVFSDEETKAYQDTGVRIRQIKRMLERIAPVAMAIRNADGPPFGPSVATTYVQIRGAYDQLGEPVEPGFLSAVEGHGKPAKLELDRYKMFPTRGRRMTLAKWIASEENPLTARVMVNRIWHHHFGRGIVDSTSDFGKQGGRPTHPELLDWLSTRFVEEKWSIKAMHRLILTSAAYRQASIARDAKTLEADADGTLLSRFPRRRLEGEAIRDSVLAVSGRLNGAMPDLPVFPPLPGDLAEAQKVQGFNTWEATGGPEGRARSVYIFQRRSLNFPLLEVFDAGVPNTSCSRRVNSVTALQPLTMYNGEFVNEESKHFADRVQELAGPDRSKQVHTAFELALNRRPNDAELRKSIEFLERDDLAGFCRVLLNTTEFVYVD